MIIQEKSAAGVRNGRGEKGNFCLAGMDILQRIDQAVLDRIHRGGMERIGQVKRFCGDALLFAQLDHGP